MSRRATIGDALGLTVACCVLLGQLVAVAIVSRFGQWIYTTLDDRLALHGLLAAGGVLAGAGIGFAVWLALLFLDLVINNSSRVCFVLED